jgi:peptidoglycan-associated lipoprotein
MKFRSLLAILTLAALVALSGCKGAQKNSGDGSDGSGSVSDSDINSDMADSDSGHAMGLQTVHYDYDSSTLSGEAKSTLNNNASILKDNGSVKIQIEGHCDERGGIQYNIALAERRAKSAKSYLVEHGVAASRISVISYGKEKPLDPGHSEEAWSKNRRANFRITEK